MKLAVVVVSDDEKIRQFVGVNKTNIIPQGTRKGEIAGRANNIFDTSSIPLSALGGEGLTLHLTEKARRNDGVIALVESQFHNRMMAFSNSVFLVPFNVSPIPSAMGNSLGSSISRAIRYFGIYVRLFTQAKYQKIFLLPLNNFRAKELQFLQAAFLEATADSSFAQLLERRLSEMGRRQFPKRKGLYEKVYLVDDGSRHFEYGLEQHSHVETTCPPHSPTCELNSILRFGAKYDTRRHFNVSLEDRLISDSFVNCHGELAERASTHINMFPNGFLG